MHLMRRRGSETYPRGAAGSPAAAQPFVQLGLSADVPYVDGVPLLLEFDTIVYQSSQFGDFETEGGADLFFMPFGVYVATLQVVIDEQSPTTLDVLLQIGSRSAADASGAQTTISGTGITISAVRLGSETPYPGHVLPVIVVPRVLVTGGGNGNVVAVDGDTSATKLFIWQLAQFQPTP